MTKAADEAREAAKRIGKRPATEPAPEPSLEPTPAERAEPLRITLDFAPALHNELEDWVIRARRTIGAKISRADVIRVLVRQLLNDEAFADEVLQTLRQNARRR
jgi:hypothetical protein